MKFARFLCFFALVIAETRGDEPTVRHPSLAIHLTATTVDLRRLVKDSDAWKLVKLREEPVLTEFDIVSYDFVEHVLTLRPEAVRRLPKATVSGLPFVVVVNKERIYLGAFVSGFSSASFTVPCIVGRPVEVTDQKRNTLTIQRAYPGSFPGLGADPRPDERIRRVLAAFRKLK